MFRYINDSFIKVKRTVICVNKVQLQPRGITMGLRGFPLLTFVTHPQSFYEQKECLSLTVREFTTRHDTTYKQVVLICNMLPIDRQI